MEEKLKSPAGAGTGEPGACETALAAWLKETFAGYFLVDREGYLLEANAAWLALHGYRLPEEAVGRHLSATLIDTADNTAAAQMARLLGGPPIPGATWTRRRKDGSVGFHTLTARALHQDDRVIGVEGFIIDTSELNLIEAELGKKRKKLAEIIEFLPDATCAVDREGRVIIWNRAIEEMTGIPASRMIGQGGHACSVPFRGEPGPQLMDLVLGAGEIPARYTGLIRSGETVMAEVFCPALHGGRGGWVSAKCAPLHDESGEIIGAIESVRDITEEKQAQSYRELGRDVLHALSEPGEQEEMLPQVLSLLRARTGVDAVAVRLKKGDDYPYFAQLGFPDEFLAGEGSLAGRNSDGATRHDRYGEIGLDCVCGQVISGRTDPASPLYTKGGSFWTNDALSLLDLPPEEVRGRKLRLSCMKAGYASLALLPIRNKEAIVGLLQFNGRNEGHFTAKGIELLEGIASHLGAALQRKQAEMEKARLEEQLLHAQKMESVGRLAGGVAHDFNNMLGVIMGHANLALDLLPPDHPLQVSMGEILKAAERSAGLTRQLLAFARKQTATPRVLDLNETVAGIFKMLERLIGERNKMTWHPGEELWPVKVDPSQVDQILANLCVNACDSVPDGGLICVETQNCIIDQFYCSQNAGAAPGEYVRLSVSDNGCGMDRETIARIFEPFFTTKSVGAGTGLGLATVYGIVKQNNGFINVYSEPELGTTFTVYLPSHPDHLGPRWAAEAVNNAPRGRETVLVVEDEPAILNITTMMLRNQGYRVLSAARGAEAIRLAGEQAGEIHLLLTDVVMPEMNGLQLAEALQPHFPGLRRLFMSGYTAEIIAHHGVIDEGLYFIQKPFSLPDLAAKVREVLDTA